MGITVQSIFKSYRNGDQITEILKNISFEVDNGEFLAIIGPSGSGKSTLMNIIGCLDRPTKGTYYLAGQDTSKLTDRQLAKVRNRYVGFIFQSFNLLPQYTALENVELPLLYANTSLRTSKERAKTILQHLGLGERLEYTPNQLSGGQKQRVAIARALVTSPTIILADEPTGSLDSKTGQEVLDILRELNSQGKTIIIVTHDLNIAKGIRRVVRIKDGILEEVKDENPRKLSQ